MGAFEAPPATPETMLGGLWAYILEQVALGNIDARIETGLLAKVNAAVSALDRGKAHVAMNTLRALINQTEAQTEKKITLEVAGMIIERTNAITTALGG